MNLQELVALAYERAPAMREAMDRAGVRPGDVRSMADLARIPVTRKDALLDRQKAEPPFGGFLAVEPAQLERIFLSPGPIYDPQAPGDDPWRFAPALAAAGVGPGDIVQNCFGYHFSPAGFMFDKAARAVGAVVVPAGVGQHELQLRVMADLGVTAYAGLPSFLLALLQKAAELGVKVEPGAAPARDRIVLRKALVSAEPLPPSLREQLQGYGLSVFQAYGTADVGHVGYECERKSGMHLADGAIVQVCDLETGTPLLPGELGEVVVTVFDHSYPLIRFGTGDLSVYTDEPCPCGRASHRLLGIRGRVGEAVKVRGMFVHPRQLDEVMARLPEVRAYQAVVTRGESHRDSLTLRVALRPDIPEGPAFLDRLRDAVQGVVRVRPDIELVGPEAIPADAKRLVDERTWFSDSDAESS